VSSLLCLNAGHACVKAQDFLAMRLLGGWQAQLRLIVR
jgi:hypothetical protein